MERVSVKQSKKSTRRSSLDSIDAMDDNEDDQPAGKEGDGAQNKDMGSINKKPSAEVVASRTPTVRVHTQRQVPIQEKEGESLDDTTQMMQALHM
jgi:hypothetical protein